MNYGNRSSRPEYSNISLVRIMILSVLVVFTASSTFAQYQLRKTTTPTQQKASITVTDPAGNATWEKGQRYTIKWKSEGRVSSVKIVLIDQASKSHDVVRSTTNSGSYTYSVSTRLADGAYRVVVMTADGKTRSESGGTVTIKKRTLGGTLQPSTGLQPTGTTPTTTTPTDPAITVAPSVGTQPAQSNPGTLPQAGTGVEPVNQPNVGGLTGLTQPDLELIEVRNKCYAQQGYNSLMGWSQIKIGNNGNDFTGNLLISGRNDYQPMFAEVTENLSIPAGGNTVVEVRNFAWPVVSDSLCSVDFEVYLDQNNEIEELNENNNNYIGPVYYQYNPELRAATAMAYIVKPNGDEVRLNMIDMYQRQVICRGALFDYNAETNMALIDVKVEVQNCGGGDGNFTIIFKAKYENHNVDVEVGRVTGIDVTQGEVKTVRKRVWVDRGVWNTDEGVEVELRIYAIEAHGVSEDLFFRNRFAFCERNFD